VLYLHLNDIADMMGMPEDAPITVRHVDQAPNKPDEVVRICVLRSLLLRALHMSEAKEVPYG
jgi:hypothetical protein